MSLWNTEKMHDIFNKSIILKFFYSNKHKVDNQWGFKKGILKSLGEKVM
jgi:hypothetical protein